MRLLDFFILLILFVLLGMALFLLWANIPNLPGQQVSYQEYNINKTEEVYERGIQFYPNMRYKDRVISYSIASSCDSAKRKDVEKSFSFIEEKTVLEFKEDGNAQIRILCAEIAPTPEEEGHFVAGEGGPSEIINTSSYAVILSGKVSLYRRTKECVRPNVAIHEILHALGFDHNNNLDSVMYPVTECEQSLDNKIISEINKLYKDDSLPDLIVEKVNVKKVGRYISFEITVGNFGLEDSLNSTLIVRADDEEVKRFYMGRIDIGTRKILNVENLKGPLMAEGLIFEVTSKERELDKENNIARMRLVKAEG